MSTPTIDQILATIRLSEGTVRNGVPNYTIHRAGYPASGAYQFVDSTWNNYKGYPSAWMAPPAIQDERAAADVQRILAAHGGDVSYVPGDWYYPKWNNPSSPNFDRVPAPDQGNTLTLRQYRDKWLKNLAKIANDPGLSQAGGAAGAVAGAVTGAAGAVAGAVGQVAGFSPLDPFGLGSSVAKDVRKAGTVLVLVFGAVALIVAGAVQAVSPRVKRAAESIAPIAAAAA